MCFIGSSQNYLESQPWLNSNDCDIDANHKLGKL